MNIKFNDKVYNGEYTQIKKLYFEGKGKTDPMVNFMRANGISDDEIFIATLLGMYKGCLEMGLKV
jgi:hypothetical protein